MSKSFLPPQPREIGARASIAIVASEYNSAFVDPLLEATLEELARILPNAKTHVVRVPGANEIPVTAAYLAEHSDPTVIVALGVIIRGGTDHADLVGRNVFDSLQGIATRTFVPVINEVLLVDSEEQAAERCAGSRINRGIEAARAAAGMVNVRAQLEASHPPRHG